jgi:hypothetical protein
MTKIVWLLEETVVAIRHRQIAEHRGGEGMRDGGLLSSASARPQNAVAYIEPPPDLAVLISQHWKAGNGSVGTTNRFARHGLRRNACARIP